jgi:anti-sigma B factor antagonist
MRKKSASLDRPVESGGLPVFRTVVQWRGGAVVVTVSGDVDATTSDELHSAIAGVMQEGPDTVVVDLSGVTFLGSAGLYILSGHSHALGSVTRFMVVAASYVTRRPIELVGLQRSVEVFASLDEAVGSI